MKELGFIEKYYKIVNKKLRYRVLVVLGRKYYIGFLKNQY